MWHFNYVAHYVKLSYYMWNSTLHLSKIFDKLRFVESLNTSNGNGAHCAPLLSTNWSFLCKYFVYLSTLSINYKMNSLLLSSLSNCSVVCNCILYLPLVLLTGAFLLREQTEHSASSFFIHVLLLAATAAATFHTVATDCWLRLTLTGTFSRHAWHRRRRIVLQWKWTHIGRFKTRIAPTWSKKSEDQEMKMR